MSGVSASHVNFFLVALTDPSRCSSPSSATTTPSRLTTLRTIALPQLISVGEIGRADRLDGDGVEYRIPILVAVSQEYVSTYSTPRLSTPERLRHEEGRYDTARLFLLTRGKSGLTPDPT